MADPEVTLHRGAHALTRPMWNQLLWLCGQVENWTRREGHVEFINERTCGDLTTVVWTLLKPPKKGSGMEAKAGPERKSLPSLYIMGPLFDCILGGVWGSFPLLVLPRVGGLST